MCAFCSASAYESIPGVRNVSRVIRTENLSKTTALHRLENLSFRSAR